MILLLRTSYDRSLGLYLWIEYLYSASMQQIDLWWNVIFLTMGWVRDFVASRPACDLHWSSNQSSHHESTCFTFWRVFHYALVYWDYDSMWKRIVRLHTGLPTVQCFTYQKLLFRGKGMMGKVHLALNKCSCSELLPGEFFPLNDVRWTMRLHIWKPEKTTGPPRVLIHLLLC